MHSHALGALLLLGLGRRRDGKNLVDGDIHLRHIDLAGRGGHGCSLRVKGMGNRPSLMVFCCSENLCMQEYGRKIA